MRPNGSSTEEAGLAVGREDAQPSDGPQTDRGVERDLRRDHQSSQVVERATPQSIDRQECAGLPELH